MVSCLCVMGEGVKRSDRDARLESLSSIAVQLSIFSGSKYYNNNNNNNNNNNDFEQFQQFYKQDESLEQYILANTMIRCTGSIEYTDLHSLATNLRNVNTKQM
eukprot:TRINITY_DN828_c0_g1_i1.p1 TRINITY_DN828_c0_g1~~TRINITY_DN828_c0_g1_i1.p1  ORF type:complete len:103 (+),score=24.47 TRINITY_DN828_c0_g1_i1:2-310(+)